MTQNQYESELSELALTYAVAMSADITRLKLAIAGASESSIIAVGSGGSFTVAALLCNLHETYTGRVSRPATPLELICNPTLAASSPVFLISAEGKNPDILEALERARHHSARPVHVITNRGESPLAQNAQPLTEVKTHVFELAKKDGYLATNSLLLDSVLIARAYCELDLASGKLPANFSDLRIGPQRIEEWVEAAKSFIKESVKRGSIAVIYSPLLKPIAADLESKLSEGALLYTQLADLRSFAHGRHLWLANRPDDCSILALTEPSLGSLWEQMKSKFPAEVPTLTMALAGAAPNDLAAGLVAQMYLIAIIARELGRDAGRPVVPQFGRDLYYLDLPNIIPAPVSGADNVERSKYDVLGAKWPEPRNLGAIRRARDEFIETLEQQKFRAVVFDYDGTLCDSQVADGAPPQRILTHIERLVRSGISVGIASGRGGSIQECLEEKLPIDILEKIQLGIYNGGVITSAANVPRISDESSEFLSHVARIIVRLKAIGVPILDHKVTHPFQVSVRFRDGIQIDTMWFVIADALRQAGLDLSRMVKSKHSIDVLAEGVSKSRLIASIIQSQKIDPYEILALGDQGAWPGNDSVLLEHRFSVSVDVPSRRLDRGWKLAPPHKRDVDATIWYLENLTYHNDGSVTFHMPSYPN